MLITQLCHRQPRNDINCSCLSHNAHSTIFYKKQANPLIKFRTTKLIHFIIHKNIVNTMLSLAMHKQQCSSYIKWELAQFSFHMYKTSMIPYSGKLSLEKNCHELVESKVFADCSLVPPRCHAPKIQGRKLSQIATKPHNLRNFFFPQKFPAIRY